MTYIVIVGLLLAFTLWKASSYRGADHSQYDLPEDDILVSPLDISPEHKNVVKKLEAFHKNVGVKIEQQRQRLEDLFFQEVDARLTDVMVNGIKAEWVVAAGADPDRRLLYLHGGAFRAGSPRSHRYITARLSALAGVSVLAIDYRMQPEFKTKYCHEDAQSAYLWMLDNGPNIAERGKDFFVAGDSAGGNLTLSLIAWLRDKGHTLPNAAVGLAPLTDATMSSPTWKKNLSTDPFLGPSIGQLLRLPHFMINLGSRFTAGMPPNDPLISPLLGDLSCLPDILIQASTDEMLYGDSQRYANKARQAGTSVTLQLWPSLVHVFQGFGPELPEARDALQRIGQFIEEHRTV